MSDNAETREALVHAAIVDDGLWSPACLPSLRWSVPLVAHTGYDANPDAITCADCREIVALAALPPVAGPEVRPDETLRALSEAATPGPWLALNWQIGSESDEQSVADAIRDEPIGRDEADAAFIAAAVNHVRALLAAPAPAPGDEGLRARIEALADEWQQETDGDERYLNGPNAHYTECQELPAVIARSREHINALRALASPAPAATEAVEQ